MYAPFNPFQASDIFLSTSGSLMHSGGIEKYLQYEMG